MGIRDTLRVMVVDDMATSRGLITQALDEIGVKNYETENDGEKAIARLNEAKVHLILSDYNMPGMNGLDLLQSVRNQVKTRKIGFILVTGRPTPEIISRAKALGLNNLLKKPFTTANMKQCVESVVGKL